MFFKKKKYITINNPQKSRKNYDLTYDNVAIPEVHTHEETYDTKSVSSDSSVDFDNLAIPEVHIKGGSNLFPHTCFPLFAYSISYGIISLQKEVTMCSISGFL